MNETSERIDALRFPLICLVVLIHSDVPSFHAFPVMCTVQTILSDLIPLGATALLFVFSGYLIYHEGYLDRTLYLRKLRNRVHTLLVPYLLWNAIAIGVQVTGQLIPATKPYFTGDTFPLAPAGIGQFVRAFTNPVNHPLWFVEDLMILVALSPILWGVCHRSRGVVLIPLAVFYFCCPELHWPVWHVSPALLFYCVGICLRQSTFRPPPWLPRAIFFVWLPALALCPILNLSAVWSAARIVNIAGLWFLFGHIPSRWKEVCVTVVPVSFFLYVAHGLVLITLKKLLLALLRPQSDLVALLVYIVPPAATICGITLAYYLIGRYVPRLLAVLCGGRVRGGQGVGHYSHL